MNKQTNDETKTKTQTCYDRFEALARWKTLVGAVLRRSRALVDAFRWIARLFDAGRTVVSMALFVTDFV